MSVSALVSPSVFLDTCFTGLLDNQTALARREWTLVGDTKIFPCTRYGNAATTATIFWARNRQILHFAKQLRFKLLPDGNLLIFEAEVVDSGQYRCGVQDAKCPFLFVSSAVIIWTVGGF